VDIEDLARLEELFKGTDKIGQPRDFKSLVIPVSAAATMDAANPCAINVFLVLLTFLFYGVGRKGVLGTGFALSVGVFISYFLMGLGLIRAFNSVYQLKYIAVAFAFFFGLLSIIEFLTHESRHIPAVFAKQITKYLEHSSNLHTGFFAGAITASLLLPCSSSPYFLALNLLMESATIIEGTLLLVLYNLIIVAPFMIITFFVHVLGVKTMDMKLWMLGKRRWINLLIGLSLVYLSISLLFD